MEASVENPGSREKKGCRGPVIAALLGLLILIALSLPYPIGPPRIKIEKVVAKNDALQLKNAVYSYFSEYHKYPWRGAEISHEAAMISDHELMDILLASDREMGPKGLNPWRIPFYSGSKAKPLGNGKFRSGVNLDSDGGGELWDPWGNHYRVLVDLDLDGKVTPPIWVNGIESMPHRVIVWSPGPDGDDATVEDNVTSW